MITLVLVLRHSIEKRSTEIFTLNVSVWKPGSRIFSANENDQTTFSHVKETRRPIIKHRSRRSRFRLFGSLVALHSQNILGNRATVFREQGNIDFLAWKNIGERNFYQGGGR